MSILPARRKVELTTSDQARRQHGSVRAIFQQNQKPLGSNGQKVKEGIATFERNQERKKMLNRITKNVYDTYQ